MRQDYSKKFRASMMKKKNVPLMEEGGEVGDDDDGEATLQQAQHMPDTARSELPDINWQQGYPMTPLPRNVTGDMPVAPDTRELQAADAEARVQTYADEKRRARDVEGPFKQRPFKVDDPKLTEI